MKKENNVLAIIALIVAVVGLSVGFAAFSTTLTISFGNLQVTPESSDFTGKIYITPYESSTCSKTAATSISGAGQASGNALTVSGTSATGGKAAFTAPSQTGTYTFCIYNSSAYTAYLTSITNNNSAPTCKTSANATPTGISLTACNGMKISAATDSSWASLAAGEAKKVVVTLSSGTGRADETLNATFKTLTFNFSTQE